MPALSLSSPLLSEPQQLLYGRVSSSNKGSLMIISTPAATLRYCSSVADFIKKPSRINHCFFPPDCVPFMDFLSKVLGSENEPKMDQATATFPSYQSNAVAHVSAEREIGCHPNNNSPGNQTPSLSNHPPVHLR